MTLLSLLAEILLRLQQINYGILLSNQHADTVSPSQRGIMARLPWQLKYRECLPACVCVRVCAAAFVHTG